MTNNNLNTDRQEEIFGPIRAVRQKDIRLAALLVTLLLHGLIIWWGVNYALFPAPAGERIQAIRVFLQPLELPALSTRSPTTFTKPTGAPAPVANPPIASPLREAAPPLQSVAAEVTPNPEPATEIAPEKVSRPTVTVSTTPLSFGAPAVVPTAPAADPGGFGSKATPAAITDKAAAGVVGTIAAAGDGGGTVVSGKDLYLRSLFAHIEAHKFYPPSARRRQLEGQVRVSFIIDPTGGIIDLKVSEGHPQLEEAAMQTVRSALPLPLPSDGVSLPFSISYRMDFRLR